MFTSSILFLLCQCVYWFPAYPLSFWNAGYEVGMSDAGHSIQFLLHWLGLISDFWLMLLYPVVAEVVHFLIIFSSSICNRSRLCLFLGLLVLCFPVLLTQQAQCGRSVHSYTSLTCCFGECMPQSIIST